MGKAIEAMKKAGERDEKGQWIDPERPLLGECFLCGWPAYRRKRHVWVDGVKHAEVLACNRENMRISRSQGLDVTRGMAKLRREDVELGYQMDLDRDRLGVDNSDIANAINDSREADGLGLVSYTTIIRRCIPSSQAFEGYERLD